MLPKRAHLPPIMLFCIVFLSGVSAMLKEQATHQGLRDSEAVIALADRVGLRLLEDRAMPANNRCLIWERSLQTE